LAETNRLHSLDAARGLAALAVVVWHWQHVYLIGGGKLTDVAAQPFFTLLFPFYQAGWLAVEFFFTLSGFVFFWLYGQAISDGKLSTWKFAVARFSRLYPLHFVTLVLIAAMQGLLLGTGHQSYVYGGTTVGNFVLNLLFLQYFIHGWTFNGPEWSVGVEVLLYGLFFIYCRLLRPNWILPLLASVALGWWVMYQDWGLGRGILGFFAGGLVYEAWSRLRERPITRQLTLPLLACVVGLWAIGIAELHTHWIATWLNSLKLEGWRWLENFFRLGLVPLTVLALALHESLGANFWRRLSPLGDLTYGLYLWHFPLQLMMALAFTFLGVPAAALQSPLAFFAYMLALIAVATMSYRWLERPAQAWLRTRLTPRPAVAPAQQ
jgi:peptidoglycan/LPS O-acetylase OafA/YrhL